VQQELLLHYMLAVPEFQKAGEWPTTPDAARDAAVSAALAAFTAKMQGLKEFAGQLLSLVMLSVLDEKWKDHLYDLDHLKASIGFRGWGQKDPLLEYKKEAYDMFEDLMTDMYASIAKFVFRAQLAPAPPPPPPPPMTFSGPVADAELGVAEEGEQMPPPPRRPSLGVNPYAAVSPRPQPMRTNREETPAATPASAGQTVGRNDPCPCGSGKKYKKCHGAAA
jgi:preprotein translocase subunit SecA